MSLGDGLMEDAFLLSDDAIHVTDSDGNLVRVNPAFLELYRYDDASQIVGRPSEILWTQRWSPEYAAMRARLAAGGEWRGELPARTGDGSEVLIRITGHPMGGDGRPAGAIFFSRDRTLEALKDRQLYQAKALALLGSLGTGLAHEFNEPLASILLDAEYLRDTLLNAPGWKRNRSAYEAAESLLKCARRLRRVLGHSDLSTLGRYRDELPGELEAAMRAHPLLGAPGESAAPDGSGAAAG